MDLIRSLSWISASHLRLVRDDDSHVDRLSHRYTVAICCLFALIVSTKQYAGDPIDCWVPAQFKASYEKYADSYCWIAGSWYTPMDKELPLSERERRSSRIRYYQWVPFLLLFQAILCYVPRIVWRTLNVRSGIDIVNLVDASIKYESVDKFNDREKIMAYIVRNIERYIGARKSRYERLYGRQLCYIHRNNSQAGGGNAEYINGRKPPPSGLALCCAKLWINLRIVTSTMCFWTGKRLGNYLVVLYMFIKTLWLTNAVSQLFLLNRFIGNDYHLFGIEIIQMLLNGQEWHELRHFPRVTYCDFKIREIGNQHDWTVQCVLRINLFNEVIYIFMWFWLCILALFTLVDYLTWTARLLIPSDKLRFIKRHLDIYNYYLPSASSLNAAKKTESKYSAEADAAANNEYSNNFANLLNQKAQATGANCFEYIDIEKEKKLIREFTFKYLKDDGIFAMRILASSASDLIVTEIISELWRNFKLNYSEQAVQSVMNDDALTILSESMASSTSSGASSSSHSAATSPVSIPPQISTKSKDKEKFDANSNSNNTAQSPTSFVKKPFNYSQQKQQQQQYSPPTTGANSIHSNSNFKAAAIVPQIHQPPLPPNGPPPPVNNNTDEYSAVNAKKSAFNNNNNIYPQIQQRTVGFHESTQHSSGANPNAKDTHV